jgi:hypothetical protein
LLESSLVSAAWSEQFTGYWALPYLFDAGADVMLENVQPGINYMGIPFEYPIAMRDLWIIKRMTRPRGTDYGLEEVTLEARTALEDLRHQGPWISWQWNTRTLDGHSRNAHPEGAGGAEQLLYPFRVYSFRSFVRSYAYGGTRPDDAVYMLAFPATAAYDADGSGQVDGADYGEWPDCFGGPAGGVMSSACARFDADRDRRVTLRDLAAFQNEFGRVIGCEP